MGRMTKQGIDYFSLDVQFDDKLELYLLEHESNGLAVFIVLLQLIYSNEGYYTTNGKDLALLIKKRINLDIDIITSCINAMISREIFDKDLYKKYNILTSRGIQKRFFDAAKRKKEVRVIREYLLTDINVYTNLISVNINNKNVSNNATKEEEEEEEDVKGKEDERNIDFDLFWDNYDKKVGHKDKIKRKWDRLRESTQLIILKHIELYKRAQPNKRYRKNPETYLNNESWNDEIIEENNGVYTKHLTENKLRAIANDIANDPDLK